MTSAEVLLGGWARWQMEGCWKLGRCLPLHLLGSSLWSSSVPVLGSGGGGWWHVAQWQGRVGVDSAGHFQGTRCPPRELRGS